MNLSRFRKLIVVLSLLAPVSRVFAADPLDEVDQSAREWVKLRVEATRLDAAWRSERALVESTLAALKERVTLLEEKRDLTRAKTAKDREDFDTMRALNEAAAAELLAGEARLKTLTDRLLALRPSLPPRLADALEMSYRSLAAPGLPFGERMQLAINVLNRCAQFNLLITVGEDVLTPEGEAGAKSLEVIYWGLSHGYALDRPARKAWVGAPAAGGWCWEAKPGAFDDIARLLAIARGKDDPAFIVVPAPAAKPAAPPRP